MRVGINSLLSSISVFPTDLKRIKLSTFYSGTSEQIKHLQSVGQLLRFQSNSIVTSDGYEQKIGNNLWHYSQ